MRLILASASARRQALLSTLGLPFETQPSAVEETLPAGVPAADLARVLALRKAREVASRIGSGVGSLAVVLGADTLVVLANRPLGKPGSPAEARAMLTALAGRAHAVVTAVAVIETGSGRELCEAVVSDVEMRPYGAAEIEAYLATGEPYDTAGAYAVQGAGGGLVARVEGCYTNVVGLPVKTTARLLRALGLPAVVPPTAAEGSNPVEPEPR